MAVYLVAYNLASSEDPYALEKALGTFELAGRCFDNTWVVRSRKAAHQIRDALKKHIGEHGRLIVTQCTHDTASTGATADTAQGLESLLW
jgi:hypothetical protein